MAKKKKTQKELKIDTKNLGPIPDERTFKLEGYGITVLSAPNGKGKSIFLAACQDLARGSGKPPLTRGAESGFIKGMGARITLSPKSTRHAGEFQVENLEGRFDLSLLPDPGIKDPLAADRRRIKTLLSLTGVEGGPEVWGRHKAFNADELAEISPTGIELSDIVEQAAAIAKDYHAVARNWETMARDDDKRADGIEETLKDIDEDTECDLDVLAGMVQERMEEYGSLSLRIGTHKQMREEADKAQEELSRWRANDTVLDLDVAKEAAQDASSEVGDAEDRIMALHAELAQAKTTLAEKKQAEVSASNSLTHSKNAETRITYCNKRIANCEAFDSPNEETMATVKQQWDDAKLALEIGARASDAKAQRTNVKVFRDSAEARRLQAEKYRTSADATAAVLSDSIPAGEFHISTKQRLMVNHPEQGEVCYHELSSTERWSRAVIVAADEVGEDGLIVIKQEAWEGIDVWTREAINKHLIDLKVYALTAEATRDEQDGTEMRLVSFNGKGSNDGLITE